MSITLTLLNPHADDFVATPVSFRLLKRKGLRKYGYLIDEPIRRGERVRVLIDGTLSSLVDQQYFAKLPRFLRLALIWIEIQLWLRLNGLRGKIDVYWSLSRIPDRTAVYLFSYKNCVGAFDERAAIISAFSIALINLSHYFIRTGEKAENIARLSNVVFVADSDLSQNAYFCHFFPKPHRLVVLPFAIAKRFASEVPVARRLPKCAATGTFHDLRHEKPAHYYRDFVEFFGVDSYHPVRKLIYHNRQAIADWLDCRVSPFREQGQGPGVALHAKRHLGLDVSQTEYFSFDMGEYYNQYCFAVVGEELSGAPAIGFFEAMACGCVMLGQSGTFYQGLALTPGVHYLTHDGTLETLHRCIDDTLSNPQRLAELSAAGRAYVERHCDPRLVWESLQEQVAAHA